MNTHEMGTYPFSRKSPEHKWYAFGRYYAMFPASFPYYAIEGLTDPGHIVLDPFCGRGNSLFCAMALGRQTVGIDENPLAYLYSAVRCDLDVAKDEVLDRLVAVGDSVTPVDRRTRNPFETMAWSPAVRGLLRAARRELEWRDNRVDRMLMGFVALHAQDKRSQSGLSNQLPPTIACSPRYSVRWWRNHNQVRPPDIDPVETLCQKIRRRYEWGVPDFQGGQAYEGDSRQVLLGMDPLEASLLITSPPYIDVTDYWNSHWIRLWLLGYPFRKDWSRTAKFAGQATYEKLLYGVFKQASRHVVDNGTILVRSDRRRHTADICQRVLKQIFPHHHMYRRSSEAPGLGESVYHGHGGTRSKEVDFLLARCDGAEQWAQQFGFKQATKNTETIFVT